MERRLLTAIAVALLLVTAGCSGGSSGGSGGTSPAAGTTTAAAPTSPATTTAPPTPTVRTVTPTTEAPSAVAGEIDDHVELLREAGSFTSRLTVNQSVGSTALNNTVVRRIDLAAERRLERTYIDRAGTVRRVTRFTAENRTFIRVASGDGIRYFNDSAPYDGGVEPANVTNATGGPSLLANLRRIDLARNGTGTFEGEQFRRFTASGADAWDAPLPGSLQEIRRFEMTVLVDDQGIVRRVAYTLEGRTGDDTRFSVTFEFTVSSVGTTDVETPDWLTRTG